MASETAKKLRDRRHNVWEQARGIVEKAAEENREMSGEEQGEYERLMEALDGYDEKIRGVLAAEKREVAAGEAFDSIGGKPARGSAPVIATPDGRDAGEDLRKFLRGEPGAPRSFEVRSAGGDVEKRILQSNTSPGTAVVPTDFYDRLVEHMIENSGVLQAGPTILRTAGGENLQIPKTTAHSSATSAAQAAALTSSDPTLAMVTLGAFKFGILIQVSRELLDDNGVDLLGYLSRECGQALGNKFGADLVTGAGTTQPKGFMTSATIGVTGTTTGKGGAAQYADLVDLMYSIISPYRRGAVWIAQDKTIGGFRKIVDSNGHPIWEPNVQIGAPDLLLGKPLVADPYMPAAATAAQSVAFGDFSRYFVRYVGGIRFERSDDFAFDKDLVTFRAILRGDGGLVDETGAIKTYKGPSA